MRRVLSATLVGLLSWAVLTAASAAPETAGEKPRAYADPQGRFSFQLLGDWIQLPSDAEKGFAASFILTKELAGERKVVAELLVSRAELKSPISLEDYVKAEDRVAMNWPGLRKIADGEQLTLGGVPALRNRYRFSQEAEERQEKVVYQYYAMKENAIWGITVSALEEDEALLAEIDQTLVASFQFSAPEGSQEDSPEAFRKIVVGGSLGGFALSVPKTWEVSQSENEGASLRGRNEVVYAFASPAEEERGSPQDSAARFLRERENLKELRVLSQGVAELGGVKGYAVEYSGTAKEQTWHVRLVTFARGERVFFLYLVAPEEGWSRSLEILKRIERSFSVGKPAEKAEDSG